MADALTAAYFLELRGADPLAAFTADFTLAPNGRFYKEGDRLLSYRRPPSGGFLLVRGGRLVWEYEEIRYLPTGISLRWNTDYQHFLALGGNRAFLAGEFSWPAPGWVNPVTEEEEMQHLHNRPPQTALSSSPRSAEEGS